MLRLVVTFACLVAFVANGFVIELQNAENAELGVPVPFNGTIIPEYPQAPAVDVMPPLPAGRISASLSDMFARLSEYYKAPKKGKILAKDVVIKGV